MSVNTEYAGFLQRKANIGSEAGFAPVWMPDWLFPFQSALTEWAIRHGRCALFCDCGMGKGPMGLVWAENVVRKTNGRVLYLAPLAVSHQIIREGTKFGIAVHSFTNRPLHVGITVINYERLHLFDPSDFEGVVCDESSILKNYDGIRRNEITTFLRKVRYRLLATATAAPNDYLELGTSSEALGHLGHMDMLNRFFKNDLNNSATGRLRGEVIKWRLKGHAELPFWQWVCSWARACRRPSDLGFDDAAFVLPPLIERQYTVEARTRSDGMLFTLPAVGLKEQREERRRTIGERCEKVAELVNHCRPALVWCHLNEEGDMLSELIRDAIQVSGKDSDEDKEAKLIDFIDGNARVLVTKPRIAGFGLNLQHCAHVTFFPSHSYEQYYQGVRRCWRFGQTQPVQVDVIATEGEESVLKNLQRKALQADKMFSNLVAQMNRGQNISNVRAFAQNEKVPAWL